MGIPKGTKLKDNPRNEYVGFRLTKDEREKLDFCSEKLKCSRTDVVTKGIDKVYEEIK